jgi:hypothetical protein
MTSCWNNLWQVCWAQQPCSKLSTSRWQLFNKLGTSSANTSCWQVVGTALLQVCCRFVTTCAFLRVYQGLFSPRGKTLGTRLRMQKKCNVWSQDKDIQKCNFHYKTVRRFFTEIAGGHVLSKCPKERHSPPWNIKFSICFQGGDCLSLGHLLRTWRTEKIPYAKLTWSEISVCTSSVVWFTLSKFLWSQ